MQPPPPSPAPPRFFTSLTFGTLARNHRPPYRPCQHCAALPNYSISEPQRAGPKRAAHACAARPPGTFPALGVTRQPSGCCSDQLQTLRAAGHAWRPPPHSFTLTHTRARAHARVGFITPNPAAPTPSRPRRRIAKAPRALHRSRRTRDAAPSAGTIWPACCQLMPACAYPGPHGLRGPAHLRPLRSAPGVPSPLHPHLHAPSTLSHGLWCQLAAALPASGTPRDACPRRSAACWQCRRCRRLLAPSARLAPLPGQGPTFSTRPPHPRMCMAHCY